MLKQLILILLLFFWVCNGLYVTKLNKLHPHRPKPPQIHIKLIKSGFSLYLLRKLFLGIILSAFYSRFDPRNDVLKFSVFSNTLFVLITLNTNGRVHFKAMNALNEPMSTWKRVNNYFVFTVIPVTVLVNNQLT